MKKFFLLTLILISTSNLMSQGGIGIKFDGNFSSISGGDSYGTDIGSVFTTGYYLSGLSMGDHWGAIYEFGFSRSGFKESFGDGTYATLKAYEITLPCFGVHYAFLDDWSKVRPILQARIGMIIRFPPKLEYEGEDEDIEYYNEFNFPWSVSAGVLIGKKSTLTISYGGEFLKFVTDLDEKINKTTISLGLYF